MSFISHYPPRVGGRTDRDRYIIAMALAYAITVIDNLPFRQHEDRDRDDMLTILLTLVPCPVALHEAFAWARANMGLE